MRALALLLAFWVICQADDSVADLEARGAALKARGDAAAALAVYQ